MSRARILLPAALAGLVLAAIAPATTALAANEVVAGDSLGVGISMAAGLQNVSANSVTIRGNRAIDQLRKIRPGSTVYLSLGTNDAVGPVRGIEKSIDAVLRAASASRLKLVWIGPPCVSKAWDKNARELDAILKARLAGTGVTYVSMRDPSLCTPSVRAKDGVHFNMQGYRAMWSLASTATGYQVASVAPERATAPAVEQPAAAAETPAERRPAPPAEVTSQERPRVRTIVKSASLSPIAPRAPQRRVAANVSFFTLDFRWPETARFTGSFVPGR